MRTREDKGASKLPPHLSKAFASLPLPLSGESEGASYKQLDIPSVVAMAVSTEIITLMIVFHFSCFIRQFFYFEV